MSLLQRIVISNGDQNRKAITHNLITMLDQQTVNTWNRDLKAESNDKAITRLLSGSNGQSKQAVEFKGPNLCVICERYLTTHQAYGEHRCLDPAHWQASGVLAPSDFYGMGRLIVEQGRRLVSQGRSPAAWSINC